MAVPKVTFQLALWLAEESAADKRDQRRARVIFDVLAALSERA